MMYQPRTNPWSHQLSQQTSQTVSLCVCVCLSLCVCVCVCVCVCKREREWERGAERKWCSAVGLSFPQTLSPAVTRPFCMSDEGCTHLHITTHTHTHTHTPSHTHTHSHTHTLMMWRHFQATKSSSLFNFVSDLFLATYFIFKISTVSLFIPVCSSSPKLKAANPSPETVWNKWRTNGDW